MDEDRGASRLRDGDPFLEDLANRQARFLPALTRTGVELRRTPDDLQRLLADWFTRRRGQEEPEPGVEAIVRSGTGQAPTELLPIDRSLEERVLAGMQPMLEDWCGYSLEPECAFGIRVYNPGSVLYRHVDRIETHAVSAVLQVAQDVDAPWPLVSEGADGARHEVDLEPGDALLYEGARLPHYRDEPLQGRFYAAVFVHFRPRWWRFTREGLEHGTVGARRSLDYGRPPERDTPRSPSHRYLAFEKDYGGWSNVLMQFEILVALAWLTGRTLVLPPPARFYLLGDGPHGLEDFLDLDRLRRYLPVLSHAEFVAREKLAPVEETPEGFHAWMGRHAHTPGWHGLEDVVVDPSDALEHRPELAERVAGRRAVTLAELEKHDLVYFPMTEAQRIFGVAECFFLLADPDRERRLRTLLRDAVRYRPEIVSLAEQALASRALAARPFSALHVRRGDFGRQYPETQISEQEILRNVRAVFEPGETLYLATDARDGLLLRLLRDEFHVVAFADLPEDVTSRTPAAWCGMLEMLVCAAAPGRFVGTRLSTFSARIATLRGHLSRTPGGSCAGHDTTLYYTQPPFHGSDRDPLRETREPWWRAIRSVPIWSRAYHEVWTQTES